MIGSTIQYVLYILLGITTALAVAGLFLAVSVRRGYQVNLLLPVSGLSLIAGTAPYIGLFGTVWHIIQALSGIGSGNLNVAAIAQPIGEALYATLWGLGCAILAMIAHRFILVLLPDDATPETHTGGSSSAPAQGSEAVAPEVKADDATAQGAQPIEKA